MTRVDFVSTVDESQGCWFVGEFRGLLVGSVFINRCLIFSMNKLISRLVYKLKLCLGSLEFQWEGFNVFFNLKSGGFVPM